APQTPAFYTKPVSGFGIEVGMLAEISVGAPIAVPPGVHQHRLARDLAAFEGVGADREAILPRAADDDARHVGERSELELGQVGAIGVTVERAVEIGAGVG